MPSSIKNNSYLTIIKKIPWSCVHCVLHKKFVNARNKVTVFCWITLQVIHLLDKNTRTGQQEYYIFIQFKSKYIFSVQAMMNYWAVAEWYAGQRLYVQLRLITFSKQKQYAASYHQIYFVWYVLLIPLEQIWWKCEHIWAFPQIWINCGL